MRIIFLLLLLARASLAQVTQLPDQKLYRGADYSFSLLLTKGDSALASSATLSVSQSGNPFGANVQPTTSRAGRTLSISWSATQTSALPDGKFWLEIKAASSVRFAAWVLASKTPSIVTAPGSYTVVSPIAVAGAGSTSKSYPLPNVGAIGYRIIHGKGTRVVTAEFFRNDNDQQDTSWRIKIIDSNTVEVIGPVNETFPGEVILNFPIQSISN